MIRESQTRLLGLQDLVQGGVTPGIASIHFAAGFEKALGIRLKPGVLTALELEWADRLARTKYRTDLWNVHRSAESLFNPFLTKSALILPQAPVDN